jgi:hypothetical protein
MRYFLVILILPFVAVQFHTAQDTLLFQGQLSGWLNYNAETDLPVHAGLRYIPVLNYRLKQKMERLIDFETSVNINGTTGIHLFDTAFADGNIKPYRMWARYSSDQFEIRMGLQKINFGSATMLRPLMWFDQLDPRDPLQLTDGVWGLLARYYFLNNINIWIWGLYGNEGPKTWETGVTSSKFPELGGRFQTPVPKGEMAISYHFRKTVTGDSVNHMPVNREVSENRLGIDGKWDLGIGLWFEGSWIGKNRYTGMLSNQEMLAIGADYTFGVGNGLNAVVEHLIISYDKSAFEFSNAFLFTGSTLSYPFGISDQVSTIIFYDWKNRNLYNFINWKHQFNKYALYLMAYWNPEDYVMPQQNDSGELFAGKGIQIMLVLNH